MRRKKKVVLLLHIWCSSDNMLSSLPHAVLSIMVVSIWMEVSVKRMPSFSLTNTFLMCLTHPSLLLTDMPDGCPSIAARDNGECNGGEGDYCGVSLVCN